MITKQKDGLRWCFSIFLSFFHLSTAARPVGRKRVICSSGGPSMQCGAGPYGVLGTSKATLSFHSLRHELQHLQCGASRVFFDVRWSEWLRSGSCSPAANSPSSQVHSSGGAFSATAEGAVLPAHAIEVWSRSSERLELPSAAPSRELSPQAECTRLQSQSRPCQLAPLKAEVEAEGSGVSESLRASSRLFFVRGKDDVHGAQASHAHRSGTAMAMAPCASSIFRLLSQVWSSSSAQAQEAAVAAAQPSDSIPDSG